MSEHKEPIPSMLYNAAVGGHVTNSQQIIDENLNREQNDINQETVGTVPYNSTTPNGMGRIVLKKNDNFKEVVEAQTNGNTIFVIKYDFTLTGDVTIPANCILEFNGGSISGAYTITGNNTGIVAPIGQQIFGNNVLFGAPDSAWCIDAISIAWFGAKSGWSDSTSAFRKAVQIAERYGGTIIVPQGNYCIKNLEINKSGLTIKGTGPQSSYIVGYNLAEGDYCIKVRPLIGGSPYSNTTNGFFALEKICFYAEGDSTRDYGTGLHLVNCFAYSFTDCHFDGFKYDVKLSGCHYATITNCVFEDVKFDSPFMSAYPGIEIFNRGKGIYVTSDSEGGESGAAGISIIGGWVNNSSLNFENATQVHLRDLDIEPASNTIVIGSSALIEECRFERFTIYATGSTPQYPVFSWFNIKGDNNIFRGNAFYDAGIHNVDIPVFEVEGNNNKLIFDNNSLSYYPIHFAEGAKGNYIELHGFTPEQFTNIASYFHDTYKMCLSLQNQNIINYVFGEVSIMNFGDKVKLKNVKRLPINNAVFEQGVTFDKESGEVVTTQEGGWNTRLIFNFNSSTKYKANRNYLLLFKIKNVNTDNLHLRILPNYESVVLTFNYYLPLDFDGYICTRFKYTEDIYSIIGFECRSPEGSNFFVNDFQIIDCDEVNLEGYNKRSDYYNAGGHVNVMAPKFIIGEQLYDDANNKPIWWNGTAWVDATGV